MQWGMSEKLGPIAFGDREEQVFLGRDIVQNTHYSEKTSQEIDEEVTRIVDEQYDRARSLLQERIDVLHRMANALLERETLDAAEIQTILAGGTLAPVDPERLHAAAADEKPAAKPAETDRKKQMPGLPPIAEPGPST
jgi:cell division protease FtsH